MRTSVCDKRICTGCAACMNACPVSAISMKEGNLGHIYPHVSENCINCNKCEKVCPALCPPVTHQSSKAYAAWAYDLNEHYTSTSGGAASCFSRHVIAQGGVVYGCSCLPAGIVKHIRIDSLDDLSKLKGSKYVQSEIGFVYKQLKADLNAGTLVLFVGTPCQVAGLLKYLPKKYENLITVDIVCHGVPSRRLLIGYLSELGISEEEIGKITFRDERGFYLRIYDNKGKIIYCKQDCKDLYYIAFNDNLTFRDSCYSCRYASNNRPGDITIGDFWGLGNHEPFEEKPCGNVSLVIPNTPSGESFVNLCSDLLKLVERPIQEAIDGNHNLHSPSISKHNEKFKSLYNRLPIIAALKRSTLKRRIKGVFIPFIQYIYRISK